MMQLVIIGKTFPEPESTAAGTRMLQLIDLFQEKGFSITFLSTASLSENSFDLSQKNINFRNIILNDSSFDEIIKKIQPSVVIFDRFTTEEQFGWRITEQCPNALKILDTEDLHFLRHAREKAFKEGKPIEEAALQNEIAIREIASILRCDISLIISEFEIELLKNQFNINPNLLHYLPLFGEIKNNTAPFSKRQNFISIGNFLHEPNWQTVLQLKKIWPRIKKHLPETELHIYGAYTPEKAKQLHNEKEGFLIKGKAENVDDVFSSAKALLAPIPFGAGIKGKLLDSMKFGLPNVTSNIGSEAMHGELPWNGFIIDDEEEFIKKTILLYTEDEIWNNAQRNGYQIIEKRFRKELFEKDFMEKIDFLLQNLSSHRSDNFLGQMLQHHTLQSTKYLSKWIEEKNKKG